MKKFFTLIAAVAMAASVNAQTAKTFTEATYLETTTDNVATWITEGWVTEGSGTTAANGKKGSINPQTGEDLGANGFKPNGIMLKSGNAAKAFKMTVNGVSSIEAYGVTSSSTDSRYLYITATPDEDDADPVVNIDLSEPGYTAVAKVINLNKSKTYIVEITGQNTAGEGADVALHGIWVKVEGTSGINSAISEVSADADAATYNVLGQKVASNAKGLVIKNGKKFINK